MIPRFTSAWRLAFRIAVSLERDVGPEAVQAAREVYELPLGYYGKILRVNLSNGAISVDEHDETWYRQHLGGAAMSAYYLLKELQPGIDPLGPDNKLIIAPGILSGVPVSGNARNGVGAKSPMSGGIGKSEVGGHFQAELKHAGYDAIIIEGQSEKPVYLWINNGNAELRDASHLWGKEVLETYQTIQDETGEKFARISAIGPGGENMVRFACIMNDLKDSAGRGGMGAVMGSKKLKAIAARGKMPPEYADPEKIKALGKMMHGVVPDPGQELPRVRHRGRRWWRTTSRATPQ